MQPFNQFRAIAVALAFALIAVLIPSPAAAQTDAGWRAANDGDYCDISYYRGAAVIFMIRELGRPQYSLSGEALRMPGSGRNVTGDIRVIAGPDEVLLFGSEEAMQEQANATRAFPLDLFFSVLEGASDFTLQTEAGTEQIPLAGFAPPPPPRAAEGFRHCSGNKAMAGRSRPPIMTAFEGHERLGAEASRQRLLSEKIGYILTIDASGKPTNCQLTRRFRRRATEIALCRPMLEHAVFEPALDAEQNPVEGIFEIEIDFDMWMTQVGYLEAEDR